MKYKDLRTFHLELAGGEKISQLMTSLEDLSLADSPSSSYPFFYSPGLQSAGSCDGWSLFPPEQEVMAVTGGSQQWRVTRQSVFYQGVRPD